MSICRRRNCLAVFCCAVLLSNCEINSKPKGSILEIEKAAGEASASTSTGKYELLLHNVDDQILGEDFNVWVEVLEKGKVVTEGSASVARITVQYKCGQSNYVDFGLATTAAKGMAEIGASIPNVANNCRVKAFTIIDGKRVTIEGQTFRVQTYESAMKENSYSVFNLALQDIPTQVIGIPFEVRVSIREGDNTLVRGSEASSQVVVRYFCGNSDAENNSGNFAPAGKAVNGVVTFRGSIGDNTNDYNKRRTDCSITATSTIGEHELSAESNRFNIERFARVELTLAEISKTREQIGDNNLKDGVDNWGMVKATVSATNEELGLPDVAKYRWWWNCYDYQLHSEGNTRKDLSDNEAVNVIPLDSVCQVSTDKVCEANLQGKVDHIGGSRQSGWTMPYGNKRSLFAKKCVVQVEADLDGDFGTRTDRTSDSAVFTLENQVGW